MSHSVLSKHMNNRIVLITASNPYDFRTETTQILNELQNLLGVLTDTTFVIYDVRGLTINVEGIINSVSGFARPRTEFDQKLDQYGRMILVGTGTFVTIGAKTASRFSPEKPLPVFPTPEEAISYAQAELAKQKS